MRARRPRGVIQATDPIVRQLFEIAQTQRLGDRQIAEHTGYDLSSVKNWRIGKSSPKIFATEVFANFLGYSVKLEKADAEQE